MACVVLALTALVFAVLALQQRSAVQAQTDQASELRDVSGQAVAALTSYDYQHLDQWKSSVLLNATGSFENQFQSSFASFEQAYMAEHNRGTGAVQDVWVGPVASGKATTVVLVDITVTSLTGTHSLEPYVQVTLLKVGGRWRVDDVQATFDTSGAGQLRPESADRVNIGARVGLSSRTDRGEGTPMGMADDDLDEDLPVDDGEPPDDPDEAELEELDEDLDEVDLDDEPIDDDDEVLDDEVLEDDVVVAGEPERVTHVVVPVRDDDEDDDEVEEADSDDVEASLDVILKERLVVIDDEDDDDDDDDDSTDGDERTDSILKVLPKQPGEFVCQSCFLVKHPSQLADREAMICRDCL